MMLLHSILAFFLSFGYLNSPTYNEFYSSYHSSAQDFCQLNGFETHYYFLIDYSIHSGKKRFFIYNFEAQRMIKSGLVAHGSCAFVKSDTLQKNPKQYSNQMDSHCSSLGKYKVLQKNVSSWGIGIKYCLHGLERQNDNAFKRNIVIHSKSTISDDEIFPQTLDYSMGCPSVSNNMMRFLDSLLLKSNKPVLLWIIESDDMQTLTNPEDG